MTVAPPTITYPVSAQYVLIGREPSYATIATSFTALKLAGFKPTNKYSWLKDGTMQADMVKLHEMTAGPIWAEHEIPESPLRCDSFGFVADNFFGDRYDTGTASTPTWTTSAPLTPGAGPIPVTSGSSAVSGTFIQVDSATNSEIVTVGTGSTATSIVISASTPLRFSHLTAITITTVVAPFTHTYATLNPGSSTGNTSCQPPSHSLLHVGTPAGSGGYYADEFLYAIVTELTISAKASGWTCWSAKLTSLAQQAPTQLYTGSFSAVKGIPGYSTTNSVAGSLVNTVSAWSATWTRDIEVVNTADGQQGPYALLRGPMESKFKLSYSAVSDESPFTTMSGNVQPSLAWVASNGGSGAALYSLGINSALGGFQDSVLTPGKVAFGYEVSGEFVGSSTYAGNSGGRTLSQLILTNAVASY